MVLVIWKYYCRIRIIEKVLNKVFMINIVIIDNFIIIMDNDIVGCFLNLSVGYYFF